MDRKNYSRLIGVIFVVGAVFGLIISIGGLIVLWSTKANVTSQVTGTAELVGRTIKATSDTVTVAGATLDEAGADLTLVQGMLGDMAKTLDNSSGMISSTADLVGTNMIDFVNNTKTSLVSVQNSAKMIDNTLATINSLWVVGPALGKGYDPNLKLQDSVANVSRSLDPLPEAFTKIRRDLDVSSANVATVKTEMDALTRQVDAIQSSLDDARKVVIEYRGIMNNVELKYSAFEKRLPVLITTFYLGVTLILIWVFIIQVGLLLQGITLLG